MSQPINASRATNRKLLANNIMLQVKRTICSSLPALARIRPTLSFVLCFFGITPQAAITSCLCSEAGCSMNILFFPTVYILDGIKYPDMDIQKNT